MQALGRAANIVNNVTSSFQCYSRQDVYSLAYQTGSPNLVSFAYQVCTQVWRGGARGGAGWGGAGHVRTAPLG